MKSHEFREDIDIIISKIIKHPTSNQIKDLLKEHITPLIIDELSFLIDKHFFEQKAQINEALLLSIKWVLKEEFVHEFENPMLDKISTKISNPILDKTAISILEKAKKDLLNKDMLFKIIYGLIKHFLLSNDEDLEGKSLEEP
jgi:hypothetical protein